MAVNDVQQAWPRYRQLFQVMYTGINNPTAMENAVGTIGPLPADPGEWTDWLDAYKLIVALDQAVQVTDAALQAQQQFVVVTNQLAAATSLPMISASDVNQLISQLQVVSNAIKQDQRFAAALKIAGTLADNIKSDMAK